MGKLESNMIEPSVGHQDHRCTSPKVEAFVTRISLVCISFHERTDHPPEFSGTKLRCPRPAYSAHCCRTDVAPHTETGTESETREAQRLRKAKACLHCSGRFSFLQSDVPIESQSFA